MCGRFSVATPRELIREIQRATRARIDTAADESELFRPRFNVAPTQTIPVVAWSDGPLITLARWGLQRRNAPPGSPQINVRRESLGAGRAAGLLRVGRCLVIADGFFEWHHLPDGRKQPVRFRPGTERAVAFAGLATLEHVRDAEMFCTAIITGAPEPARSPVHDRMPVVLSPDVLAGWLNPSLADEGARALLTVPPVEDWFAVDVSERVNSVKNDDAECVALWRGRAAAARAALAGARPRLCRYALGCASG